MKKKVFTSVAVMAAITSAMAATAMAEDYKVGIVQYVDDASLNQITENIEKELDAKGEELGVTFNYADYFSNAQADSSVLNRIFTDLLADQVDVIVAIATPVAMVMQSATEDTDIPVVFSAVSDPVGAGLVESMDAPGGNITGT
ncbi:MAG: ABC transporter substrate binding protein [Lachnospiraceae bacterium]